MNKLIIAILIFYAPMLNAAFEDMGFGTRGAGLGPGFVALADDVSAIYYNPAGLSQIMGNEILFSFSKLYWGLGGNNSVDNNNNLYSLSTAYSRDFQFMQAGIGYYRFAVSSYYSENIFLLSGAKEFKDINLKTGLSLKLLNDNYAIDPYTSVNPIFNNGYSASGFGLDLGALYRIKDFSLGFSLINLYTSDMGLVNTDRPPIQFTLGAAYFIPEELAVLSTKSFVPVLGIQVAGSDYNLGLGSELWFFQQKQLGVRFNFQFGNNSYYVIALGVSYKKGLSEKSNIRFDYGFDYPLSSIKGTYGTHRVGICFEF